MDHGLETEAAAGVSAGGFLAWRRRHAVPPGTGCFNCGTKLEGPWCHHCGQLGEDYHRSAFHLVGEVFEGLFHADGRLAQTLPRLLLRPAALTRDYLAGKRAPQVPPLRLFLVVLVILFVVGEVASSRNHVQFVNVDLKPADRAEIMKEQLKPGAPLSEKFEFWMRDHAIAAVDNKKEFSGAMAAWAHDFAFLTLPLSGLILAVMFAFRRGFVLFDHLVFSMHSLAFLGLLFTTALLGQLAIGSGAFWLFALSPVHLFGHMRGVYGTGTLGTLVRMAILFLVSAIGFGLLMIGLIFIGLEAVSS